MIPVLAEKSAQLSRLCERHRVRRLEVFGSAAGDGFAPRASDIDFLVDFLPVPPGKRADAYFGLLQDLESLFGRPVDLVMVRAVRNPYFLEAIASARKTLYAA